MVVRDLEISKVNPIWKIHQNPQEQWIIESVAAIGKPFLIFKKGGLYLYRVVQIILGLFVPVHSLLPLSHTLHFLTIHENFPV